MKKKRKTIIWVLLACVILAILLFLFVQRENLVAIYKGSSCTTEELELQLEENEALVMRSVENAEGITIRSLTEEEKKSLQDGTLTMEDAIDRMMEGKADYGKGGTKAEEYQKELSALVAQACALREQYTGELARLESAAAGEYASLPSSEMTKSRAVSIAQSYMSKAYALESQCDGKMDAIVGKIRTLIQDNNGDMEVADTIVSTYAKEKSLKKAWYFSRLRERGLM